MEVLEGQSDFVNQSALAWLEKREPRFAQLHIAVQRRILQLQLFGLGLSVDFGLIEHLRLRPGVLLTLSPEKRAAGTF